MQLTGGLDVLIQIFDVTGKPVKTIDAYFPEGLNPGPLYWDGTGNSGQKLGSGIYPYRVVFKGNNGATSQTTQKLIIIR
jgi:flagellar hook assembly protein FlgD